MLLSTTAALAQSYESALLDGVAARDRALETQSQLDWQRALQHFERAVSLKPTKEALFEYAEAAVRLGLVPEAYRAYESALAAELHGKAELRARAFLDAHAAELARLEVSGPPSATLHVDDQVYGPLPLARGLMLAPGIHRVRLERAGFQAVEQQVDLASATVARLNLTLTPLAPPATPELVATPPGAALQPFAGDSPSHPPWATPTVVSGTVLFGLGVAGFVTAHVLLTDARGDLKAHCLLDYDATEHECLRTTEGQGAAAQRAANRALTFENLRLIAGGAAALGLVASGVGLLGLLSSDTRAGEAVAGASLELSSTGLSLGWRGRF